MKKTYYWTWVITALLSGIRLDAQCVIPGYGYLGNYDGHKYYQSLDYTSWATAQVSAAALGGQLVVIGDAMENAFIEAALGGAFCWIGLSDHLSEGTFTWVTGDPLGYSNWYAFQPDNGGGATDADFVAMTFSGQWEDYPAFALLPHILELPEEDCPCPGMVDADCDGVNDDCDQCPGGDDSGPCAAQVFPGFSGIPAGWICSAGEQKVYICHDGNTLCVGESSVQAHLNHGDFLGPCTGCLEPRSAAWERGLSLDIFPNPATDRVDVRLKEIRGEGTIRILDQLGRPIHSDRLEAGQASWSLVVDHYPPGLYFIQVVSNGELATRTLTVALH